MNWFFSIFIMQFLLGAIFFILGLIMYKFPPKKINDFYGYRTSNSMKSIEKWNYAQKYSSILTMKIAFFQIIFSFSGSFFILNENTQFSIGIFAILSTCTILFYFTEKKLNIGFSKI